MRNHKENRDTVHFSIFKDEPVRGLVVLGVDDFASRFSLFREKDATDFYTLIISEKGKAMFCVDNENGSLAPGSILLVPPGRSLQLGRLDQCGGFIVCFFEDFYTEEYSLTRLLSVFNLFPTDTGTTADLIFPDNDAFMTVLELVRLIQHKTTNPEFKTTPELFTSLLNTLLIMLEAIKKGSKEFSGPVSAIMEKLILMIDAHHFRQHSPLFYSDALNIGTAKLNSMVRSCFGVSLKRLIVRRIMLEARKRLTLTDDSVAEIGYSLGFEDNSYFTKVFKKYHKLTPAKFRKLHKKHH